MSVPIWEHRREFFTENAKEIFQLLTQLYPNLKSDIESKKENLNDTVYDLTSGFDEAECREIFLRDGGKIIDLRPVSDGRSVVELHSISYPRPLIVALGMISKQPDRKSEGKTGKIQFTDFREDIKKLIDVTLGRVRSEDEHYNNRCQVIPYICAPCPQCRLANLKSLKREKFCRSSFNVRDRNNRKRYLHPIDELSRFLSAENSMQSMYLCIFIGHATAEVRYKSEAVKKFKFLITAQEAIIFDPSTFEVISGMIKNKLHNVEEAKLKADSEAQSETPFYTSLKFWELYDVEKNFALIDSDEPDSDGQVYQPQVRRSASKPIRQGTSGSRVGKFRRGEVYAESDEDDSHLKNPATAPRVVNNGKEEVDGDDHSDDDDDQDEVVSEALLKRSFIGGEGKRRKKMTSDTVHEQTATGQAGKKKRK